MKLASFEISTVVGPVRRIGAAVDGRLIDFAAAYAAHLETTDPGCDAQRLAAMVFPPDMVSFLGAGDLGRQAAEHAINAAGRIQEAFGARTSYAASEVKLLAPVTRPRVIRDFLTFEGHMLMAGKALGRPSIPPVWYEVPAYYKGDPDTVSGPDDVIEWPKYCEKFDFELELAVVI
ncbi:MAG: fumarylacetoacetate hydrolase family protein, partial [Acidobacteria bacterium]